MFKKNHDPVTHPRKHWWNRISFPLLDAIKEKHRWNNRNDLTQSLPFLEGIGVDFRHIDNRFFVKQAHGLEDKLLKTGFVLRDKPVWVWPTYYWRKYSIALEVVREEDWEALSKAHAIYTLEYPTLSEAFIIVRGGVAGLGESARRDDIDTPCMDTLLKENFELTPSPGLRMLNEHRLAELAANGEALEEA